MLDYPKLPASLRKIIAEKSSGYGEPVDFYVKKLEEGISTLAAAFYPKSVVVRFSDFKSNEYSKLIGGQDYEPQEENAMLGFRGAYRYLSDAFRPCFELECRAIRQVREEMGFTNIHIMVPFVRNLREAKQITFLLEQFGLKRGAHKLKLIMMCEIPSNVVLAKDFLKYFDGFSIGSNDLTQLMLGVDRDSGFVAEEFDECNPAVRECIRQAIKACHRTGKHVGICGQAPSDHPGFATWLVKEGIDSISLNPDSVIPVWLSLAKMKTEEK